MDTKHKYSFKIMEVWIWGKVRCNKIPSQSWSLGQNLRDRDETFETNSLQNAAGILTLNFGHFSEFSITLQYTRL